MTPVERGTAPTWRRQNRPDSGTRDECWVAWSIDAEGQRDGRWTYHRLDGEPGTPWAIVHTGTGMALPYEWYSSLDEARHDTYTRPREILRKILAEAGHIANGEQYLPAGREKASAAVPVLMAAIRDLPAEVAG